jgi:transposase
MNMDTTQSLCKFIVAHYETGLYTQEAISNMFHCHRTTVRDIIHLYQREGSVDAKRLRKYGRRPLLSQRDERSAANPRVTAKEVGSAAATVSFSNVEVDVHTVLARLQHLTKHRWQHDIDGVESVLGGMTMIGEK